MSTRIIAFACMLASLGAGAPAVMAQDYPVKPVRIVIAQAAGSTTDVLSRLIGQKLSEVFGQQIIVDNRPGAGGTIGTEMAARAAPDGYTLFMGNNSTHGSNSVLYSKLPYDAVKDFAPITLTAVTPYVIVVNLSLPATTIQQFIALAKSKPGQIHYGSAGNGSTPHFSGELFKWMAGIDIVHVAYKGSPPALAAVMAGEVSMMFDTITGALANVRAGKIKALAVTTAKRHNLLPDLPTVAEAGLAGYDMDSWFGLLAPAGTPAAIVERLNGEVVKILNLPDVKAALAKLGLDVLPGTPARFADVIKAEIEKTARIAKVAGIKAE